jgi:trk system potassium uptake protein TrkH
MTLAVMLSNLMRRRVSARERVILANSYNLISFEGLLPFVRRIFGGTLLIELCGAIALAFRFIPLYGWGKGIWHSIFHSVSAFCNAGFDLMGGESGAFTNLTSFAPDPLVNITVMLLIMIGGIGFVVWDDILYYIKERRRFSVYTKLVLTVSAILWIGGALIVAIPEWNNPATLGMMNPGEKVMASLFQSVTFRTAGFNTISLGDMHTLPKLASVLIMFVGGASGSTAGGVKVGTVGILVYAAVLHACGRKHITVFRRTVPSEDVIRAFTVVTVQFLVTMIGALFLIGDGAELMSALFETFSASATVGLSLGLTPTLSLASKIVVMILMFFGRVGILTIATLLSDKEVREKNQMQYADTHLMIG